MDNLIRRNKERAVVEDAAEIARQREARYRSELERMAVDQEARITGLDDRDRRTLEAIREEIQNVKITVQDDSQRQVPAPAPSYWWELSLTAPLDGAVFTLLSDTQAAWNVSVRAAWRLNAPLGPSEGAQAVLLAGRVYAAFGDGAESDLLLLAPDSEVPWADGGYSGEVDLGIHAYPPGTYTLIVSGGGPLGGTVHAQGVVTVHAYDAPPVYNWWTWDGASCAEQTGPAIPAGAYLSLAQCQAAHPPPVPPRWRWTGAECVYDPAGTYLTIDACQAAHGGPPPDVYWAWISGHCEPFPGGPPPLPWFRSEAECMAAHQPVTPYDYRLDAPNPTDGTFYRLVPGQPTAAVILGIRWSAAYANLTPAQLAAYFGAYRVLCELIDIATGGHITISDHGLLESTMLPDAGGRAVGGLMTGQRTIGAGRSDFRWTIYPASNPSNHLATLQSSVTAGY